MSENERLQKFKELIKQGYDTNKALAEIYVIDVEIPK